MEPEALAVRSVAAAVERPHAGVVQRVEVEPVHGANGLPAAVHLLRSVGVLVATDATKLAVLTRNRPGAPLAPVPSSSSRTKPSTNEPAPACHATVIELFSALHSSATMHGAPGAAGGKRNDEEKNTRIRHQAGNRQR